MPLIYWPHSIMAASLPLLLYGEVIRACWRRSWGKRRQGSIINAKVYVGPTTYPHLKRQMKGHRERRRNKENGVIRATCNSLGFPFHRMMHEHVQYIQTSQLIIKPGFHTHDRKAGGWEEWKEVTGVERGDRRSKFTHFCLKQSSNSVQLKRWAQSMF